MLPQLLIAAGTFSSIWGLSAKTGDRMVNELVSITGQVEQLFRASALLPEQAARIIAPVASAILDPGEAQ
jgi:hypothetical protein